MRNLTESEVGPLDCNDEKDEGCVAVETTVEELAALGVGTFCGSPNNQCFAALAAKGYGKRKCRGWYQASSKTVWGMFHIRIQTDKTAEKMSDVVSESHGSLRFNGDSLWDGYKEFEIE